MDKAFLLQPLEIFENKCLVFFSLNFFDLCVFFFSLNFIDVEFFLILFVLVFMYSLYSVRYILLLSNYKQIVFEVYLFIENIVLSQTLNKANFFVPLMVVVFYLILFGNVFGLVPFSLCITSQLFITFLISFSLFIGLTIYGFIFQGLNFLKLFVPSNVPSILLPFLVLIEIISYISRTFSLAIRLFANMVAGHALLHILTSAYVLILKFLNNFIAILFMIIPLLIIFAIVVLEFGIAFLQAYVFIVLISIYLVDTFGLNAH